jgi:circadian clock protein KaiB
MSEAPQSRSPLEEMEAAASLESRAPYILRLYLAGPTPQATRAVVNIRKICEEHLKGRYELEVIDLLQNPGLARIDQVIAAPTLAKVSPLPVRRFIGDLSETDRILKGLGLPGSGSKDHPPATPANP